MNIAELFVNLGIKGTEKTVGALGSVKSSLGGVKDMSLEAKAGIVAVMYGMERLMSNSAQAGTGLTNFAALTGLSARQLQQWQYAARQAGVSSEEFTGSLKGVQNSMTNMLLGKGAPEGLAMLANKVGFDPKRARDTFYVMEQLQKFAQQVPKDIGNNALKSFGLGEGAIAAMRRNAFRPDVFKKAPTYSDKETGQLDKVNVAWGNLGQKIEMAMGHFTAKHGMQLVSDLSKVTDQVIRMVEAFQRLADTLKIFQLVGKVFEGWEKIFGGTADAANNINKDKEGVFHGVRMQSGKITQGLEEFLHGAFISAKEAIEPAMAGVGGGGQTIQNNTVNQNMHFQHDGKDHKKTGDSVKKATQDAHRQISAQRQVN